MVEPWVQAHEQLRRRHGLGYTQRMAKQKQTKKPPLGSGKRFEQLSDDLQDKGADDPDALAAWIGRKKYGAGKMSKLSRGKK
jgi:hypothetical protein